MTLNLLDWDEDLQTDSAEEYQALLNGLWRSQGFGLFFVQCSPFSGGKLIERIQTDLTDKKIAVLKFDQPITDGNVFKRIQTFLAEHNLVEILIVQGLENSLFDAEETKKRMGWSDEKANAHTWSEVPPVLINLNQQRERFRDSFPICFIFLLPQYAIRYLIHRAPDFFDWRSGLINYASDAETLAQESERILDTSDYTAYTTWSEEERTTRVFAIQTLIDEPKTIIDTRARLYFEQGLLFTTARDFPASVTCFDKAVILKPDFHYALNNKGSSLYVLGQYEVAIAAFDQALAIQPGDYAALYNKGIALRSLGQHEAAIAAYDQALAIKPDAHEVLNSKGITLENLGQYEAAVACYDAALTIDPDNCEVLNNKGVALAHLAQYKSALACFNAVLTINPNFLEALYHKGNALLELGQYEDAVICLNEILIIKPNEYKALISRGIAYLMIKDKERAKADFDRANHISGHSLMTAVMSSMADLIGVKGEEAEYVCLSNFIQAISSPDLLSQAQEQSSQPQSASSKIQQIKTTQNLAQTLGIDPSKNLYQLEPGSDDPVAQLRDIKIAALLLQLRRAIEQGKYTRAIDACSQILEIKPDDHSMLYNKACCYGLQGDVENAIDCLQKAIALDPKYRTMAKTDTDFDPVRHGSRFRALVEGDS